MLRQRVRPDLSNVIREGLSSSSYSISSQTGEDGQVVYRNRRFSATNGVVKEEFAETYDGKRLERSLTRQIGDRSISSRTVAADEGKPETNYEVRGLEGDDALSKFEAEWTRSSTGLPDLAELGADDTAAPRLKSSANVTAESEASIEAEREDLQGDGVKNLVHAEDVAAAGMQTAQQQQQQTSQGMQQAQRGQQTQSSQSKQGQQQQRQWEGQQRGQQGQPQEQQSGQQEQQRGAGGASQPSESRRSDQPGGTRSISGASRPSPAQ